MTIQKHVIRLVTVALGFCILASHAIAVDVVVRQVADINPLGDSRPYGFTEFGNQLYFGADGPSGQELYTTDGGAPTLVQDIFPGGDALPAGFVEFNNSLYFAATGEFGRELYQTDGSSVSLVADVAPNDASSNPIEITPYKDWLYFSGSNSASGLRELFRTDGSVTEHIPIEEGIASSPASFAIFDDELYFAATGSAGVELYKTDGTDVELVADVNPNGNAFPGWLTPYQDRLVFWATVEAGLEPFEFDGNSVRQLADINPGLADSSPNRFTEFNGNLYFGAHDGSSPEVYRYDGIEIQQVQDLNPLEQSENEGFPWAFDVIDEKLFVAAFGDNGLDLYSLAIDAEGNESLQLEADTNPVTHSRPIQLTEFADDVFFISFDEEGFQSNEPRLYQLNDRDPQRANHHGIGTDVIEPADLTVFSGELFFRGIGDDGNELYKATLAGDANGDGAVNFTDFLTFSTHFSVSDAVWEQGDFDLNGEVNFSDFLVLSANFGERATSAVFSAVPEPNGLAFISLAMLLPLRRSRKR